MHERQGIYNNPAQCFENYFHGNYRTRPFLTARFTRFFVRQKQSIKIKLKKQIQPVQVDDHVFIVRNSTRLEVFSRVCPHLGCKVKLDAANQHFVCPCHGSQFQLNGVFIKGPADKNLKELPFKQTDDQLTVTL